MIVRSRFYESVRISSQTKQLFFGALMATLTTAPLVLGQSPPSTTAPNSHQDEAAKQFVSTCTGCHTIGGGAMRGPDLAQTVSWPEPQLSAAVQSMQRKVGPLTPAQVSSLVALLKDANAKERVARARAEATTNYDVKLEPPDALLGGALFFGKRALESGGMPCNSCHRFHGEGGDLAPDLGEYGRQIDIDALSQTISRASFSVMRAAYQLHPINPTEARHIAAFMKQARGDRRALASSSTDRAGFGSGIAAFLGIAVYIALRPKGVRARLIQRANKR